MPTCRAPTARPQPDVLIGVGAEEHQQSEHHVGQSPAQLDVGLAEGTKVAVSETCKGERRGIRAAAAAGRS
jgi:hypothetical protein